VGERVEEGVNDSFSLYFLKQQRWHSAESFYYASENGRSKKHELYLIWHLIMVIKT